MNKIAVFGNAGGGKSTLSQQLSQITGLPLYALDKLKAGPGGIEVPEAEYQQAHAAMQSRRCPMPVPTWAQCSPKAGVKTVKSFVPTMHWPLMGRVVRCCQELRSAHYRNFSRCR